MDIDRLHHNFLCKTERGSGRSYDQLVEAIHQTGTVGAVTYQVATPPEVRLLSQQLLEIAEDMGYVARWLPDFTVKVIAPEGTTHFRFVFRFQRTIGANLTLRDHYAEELLTDDQLRDVADTRLDCNPYPPWCPGN